MCLLHGLRRWSVAVKGKSFFGKRTVVFAREEESKGIGARGTDRREGGTEEKGKAGGIDTFRTGKRLLLLFRRFSQLFARFNRAKEGEGHTPMQQAVSPLSLDLSRSDGRDAR